VDDAVAKGAKMLTGGKRPEMQGDLAKGNFYEPTILGDATIEMKVAVLLFPIAMQHGCQQAFSNPRCHTRVKPNQVRCPRQRWRLMLKTNDVISCLQIFSEETFGPAVPLFKVKRIKQLQLPFANVFKCVEIEACSWLC
jgi:Aldehyde dehydrogenase family